MAMNLDELEKMAENTLYLKGRGDGRHLDYRDILKLIAVVRGAIAYQKSKISNGEPMWPESWDDTDLITALQELEK